MATVMIPGALVQLFPGAERKVEVEASTVRGVLDQLDALWPGMRDRLSDSQPKIRQHITIFVDAEKATLETAVAAGSLVEIIPAMSGG